MTLAKYVNKNIKLFLVSFLLFVFSVVFVFYQRVTIGLYILVKDAVVYWFGLIIITQILVLANLQGK